jgi:hypothetical protein
MIDTLGETTLELLLSTGSEVTIMSLVKIIVLTILIILSILFFGRFLF